MNETRKCLIGRDDDDGVAGWVIGLIIAIVAVMVILSLAVFGGVFIGSFHAIKNYFASFGKNVILSNRKPKPIR